jgi:hypothetical protein
MLEPTFTEEDAMLSDESKAVLAHWRGASAGGEWQDVDRELRSVARRRCALDADEARLLSRAVRGEIWRHVGSVSLQEYLEEILGYTPRQARERVRVALALEDLPEMLEALAGGELSYSAVRELTRIATRATEREWCDHARGKKLKQIEQAVATHRRGERPSDPASPDLAPTTVEFEIRPATLALLREAQQVLAQERGEPLDDDALVAALCSAVLEGGTSADDSGRARYQVMATICEVCSQGWREGAGATLALDAADVARAQCDAQRIGSDQEPERATQDVAPMTVRFVHRRDHDRCTVPGCRSARFLELHHIVPREAGGDHEATNLTLLCDGHHRLRHEGKLAITGKAPHQLVFARTVLPTVANPTAMRDAEVALTKMGFRAPEARSAVALASTSLVSPTPEALVCEALRHLK